MPDRKDTSLPRSNFSGVCAQQGGAERHSFRAALRKSPRCANIKIRRAYADKHQEYGGSRRSSHKMRKREGEKGGLHGRAHHRSAGHLCGIHLLHRPQRDCGQRGRQRDHAIHFHPLCGVRRVRRDHAFPLHHACALFTARCARGQDRSKGRHGHRVSCRAADRPRLRGDEDHRRLPAQGRGAPGI